jgi:hypothetical protein
MDDKELARRYKRMARNIARALERRAFDEDDYDADRFGGNAICPHCGIQYLNHPQLVPCDLHVTCEGQLVKL